MFLIKGVLASVIFVAVHGSVHFTNDNLDNITVGVPFNVTWSGNQGPVTLTLMYGDINDLLPKGEIAVVGAELQWYEWTPANVAFDQYVLKIKDALDPNPNWSNQFGIKGGTATSPPTQTTTSASSPTTTTPTKPSHSKGLSTAAKVAIGIVIPVIAFVSLLGLGLWCRHRKQKSRRGDHPLRTMSTDSTPIRSAPDDPKYPVVGSNQEYRPRPRTPDSGPKGSRVNRILFRKKDPESTMVRQSSTESTYPEKDNDVPSKPKRRTTSSTTYIGKGMDSPPQHRGHTEITWNDSPTPNRRQIFSSPATSSFIEKDLDSPTQSRSPQTVASSESPTPKRRQTSAQFYEKGLDHPIQQKDHPVSVTRKPINSTHHNMTAEPVLADSDQTHGYVQPLEFDRQEHWELSAGTPYQANATLPTSNREFSQKQRAFSSPVSESSNMAAISPSRTTMMTSSGDLDIGNDDSDPNMKALMAQRERIRAEKERLRKLQELEIVEEELNRQIENARKKVARGL